MLAETPSDAHAPRSWLRRVSVRGRFPHPPGYPKTLLKIAALVQWLIFYGFIPQHCWATPDNPPLLALLAGLAATLTVMSIAGQTLPAHPAGWQVICLGVITVGFGIAVPFALSTMLGYVLVWESYFLAGLLAYYICLDVASRFFHAAAIRQYSY